MLPQPRHANCHTHGAGTPTPTARDIPHPPRRTATTTVRKPPHPLRANCHNHDARTATPTAREPPHPPRENSHNHYTGTAQCARVQVSVSVPQPRPARELPHLSYGRRANRHSHRAGTNCTLPAPECPSARVPESECTRQLLGSSLNQRTEPTSGNTHPRQPAPSSDRQSVSE